MKHIVLIACASNFEGHKKIVSSVVNTMKEIGGYTLDVLTSYGRFGSVKSSYEDAESSIYDLIKYKKYDGAIIESNIGLNEMLYEFEAILRSNGTPYVTINTEILDCPSFCQNSYNTMRMLIEHMVKEHAINKINLVVKNRTQSQGQDAYRAYESILEEHGIPVDDNRIFEQIVGVDEGEKLYNEFKKRGVEDAQAVILFHDVNALGLIRAYERAGIKVPEDVKVASLHYSTNSMMFRPDITGIVVEDAFNAKEAMYALHDILNGKEVNKRNYSEARIMYGRSCGCEKKREEYFDYDSHQGVILSKIGNAAQIKAMMDYNQSLNGITSIEEFGDRIKKMLEDIDCNEFCVCLNQRDLNYLTIGDAKHFKVEGEPFDKNMYVVAAKCDGNSFQGKRNFKIEEIAPIDMAEGDYRVLYPIHSNEDIFGYIVIKNNLFPITVYNYRICHESIGNSMEELHKQVILRGMIEELDRIRLIDYMTGTYNKGGLDFFQSKFLADQRSVVVMIDVDGLKYVNDKYGHVQGDLVIQIAADAIIKSIHKEDVVIRYGGDEFLVLSLNTDEDFWKHCQDNINNEILKSTEQRNLEYRFGISYGYATYMPNELSIEDVIKVADSKMYQNKKNRKASRLNK